MYKKDKTVRVNVRVSPEQAVVLEKLSEDWNTSQSNVVRSIIDTFIWSGQAYENKQTNIND